MMVKWSFVSYYFPLGDCLHLCLVLKSGPLASTVTSYLCRIIFLLLSAFLYVMSAAFFNFAEPALIELWCLHFYLPVRVFQSAYTIVWLSPVWKCWSLNRWVRNQSFQQLNLSVQAPLHDGCWLLTDTLSCQRCTSFFNEGFKEIILMGT